MKTINSILVFLCICIVSQSYTRQRTVRNVFSAYLTNEPRNIGAATKNYVHRVFRKVAAVLVTPFIAAKRAKAASAGVDVVPLDYNYDSLVCHYYRWTYTLYSLFLFAQEPYISERTLKFHHDKHYTKYVANTQSMIKGTDLENQDLVDIVKQSYSQKNANLFNNAAQCYNHEFYFKCMSPNPKKISKTMVNAIEKSFGSYEEFKKQFSAASTSLFGSGWVWLVSDKKGGALEIMKTANADTPLTMNKKCLLTIDVWEHAYYLDYQNVRQTYVDNFVDKLINWDFVEKNYRE